MGAVTVGRRSSQLIATCAGVLPASSATAKSASSTDQVRSLLYVLQRSPQPCWSATATLLSAGGPSMPRRNFPLSHPPSKGLQGMTPSPSFWQTGKISHSGVRVRRLYWGCRQTKGSQPIWRRVAERHGAQA
jgi:hypothetical protein